MNETKRNDERSSAVAACGVPIEVPHRKATRSESRKARMFAACTFDDGTNCSVLVSELEYTENLVEVRFFFKEA